MTTTTTHRATSKPARRADRRGTSLRRRLLVAGLLVAALGGAALLAVRVDDPVATKLGSAAPAFELASTDGKTVSLADHKGHDVLLYFSEGVGCDPFFYQQARIEEDQQRFSDAGLTVIPIVVNPVDQVRGELSRFGLKTPFLIDGDRSVSAAYDAIGRGHHADLPGHTFVLVDAAGQIRWRIDDPSMYADPPGLVSAALDALGR